MLKLHNYIRTIERKRFLKVIFLCFMIPILVMMISALLIYNKSKDSLQDELKTNCISNLSVLSQNIDNSFNELQSTTLLLSSDSNLYDIFYTENKFDSTNTYTKLSIINTLVKYKSTKNLIDSVYILNKENDEVLDTAGTSDINSFYTRASLYEKYDKNFWMNFKVNSNFYQILEPSSLLTTSLQNASSKRDVIPFVTSNIESFKSRNLFVINISVIALTDLLNKYKLFPNSKLCVINHKGVVFSSTDSSIANTISANSDFLSKLSDNKNNFFEYNFNGDKTLVVTYFSTSARFNDFIYVAFIPYNDFYEKLANIKTLAYSIIFLSVILSIILAYLMSRKIYSPIENLISILSKQNTNNESVSDIKEFDYLKDQLNKLLKDADDFKNDLSIVMPLASEQYLTKILTNNDFLLDEDVKNFIQSNHVNFKYSDFSVSIFELNFTEKYFNTYTNKEYLAVIKAITKLFNDIVLGEYPTYILNLSKNRFGILINLPQNESLDKIISNIKNVTELFVYDKDLLNIRVGVGRTYSYYIGMNQSYNEAIKALVSLSPLSNENVKVYSEPSIKSNYHYSINDENKLYNYLSGFHKEDALSFINSLVQRIYQVNPSEETIKKFYSSIYNTITRVAEEKEISLEELMGKDYINVLSDLEILPASRLCDYIVLVVDKFLSINKNNYRVDMLKITEYIKEHYTEDIYLEKIAEIFNTSDKYLSRAFKESLGIGFHEYLVSLRIAKSKALLADTDLSVAKIGEMVGYNITSTFFRLFKKLEGVTPAQYRENTKRT